MSDRPFSSFQASTPPSAAAGATASAQAPVAARGGHPAARAGTVAGASDPAAAARADDPCPANPVAARAAGRDDDRVAAAAIAAAGDTILRPGLRSHATLALCAVLHAFTHAYATLLVPLYLLVRDDLGLPGVGRASAIVTVYGLVYCFLSYPAGLLADRFSRSLLLGVGLLGNALAVAAMGLTRRYELLMLWSVLGGAFGAIFHPAANALVPAHYPRSPGMAIGLLGIGSGIGFFAGPQFAGWRAQAANWHFSSVVNWQRPLVEAGLAGFVVGVIFLLIAREAPRPAAARRPAAGEGQPPRPSPPTRASRASRAEPAGALGPALRGAVVRVALVLGLRDFAGIATLSLASIYLQRAHGLDAARTGLIVGSMMLIGVVVSPLAVYLSGGARRLPVLAGLLLAGGAVVATTPLWPARSVLWVLMTFMAFQLGSYAVSDAAMLERVPGAVRGRVVGLFLTVAGALASASPWVMGWWTDLLGERAERPSAYLPLFGTIGATMAAAAACGPLLHRLGPVQGPLIEPISETAPRTAEPLL